MKLWGGRFESGPSEVFERFSGSLHFDRRLVFADIRGSVVHTLVIRKLREKVGGLADKIHTGRSRNEQVSLDVRLWLLEEIDAAGAELAALLEALLRLARR
ncbi:MAG: argininosuccinate lyase, partial [Acidobacteria bacterium]|nr:argininosuccinate lyase [Acidobacteriota bacterium]